MMFRRNDKNELDYKTINEVVSLTKQILSIGAVLAVILAIYIFTLTTQAYIA